MRYDDDDRDMIPFTMVISVSRLIRCANDRGSECVVRFVAMVGTTGEEIN